MLSIFKLNCAHYFTKRFFTDPFSRVGTFVYCTWALVAPVYQAIVQISHLASLHTVIELSEVKTNKRKDTDLSFNQ